MRFPEFERRMCWNPSEGIPRCPGPTVFARPSRCRFEFSDCPRLQRADHRKFLSFHSSRSRWCAHTILRERKLHLQVRPLTLRLAEFWVKELGEAFDPQQGFLTYGRTVIQSDDFRIARRPLIDLR